MRRDTRSASPQLSSACRRFALGHYSQALIIVTSISIAVVTGSLLAAVLLLLVGEAVLLGLVPLLPSFQRFVQERLAYEARAAVIAERARLMPGMIPAHRDELAVLESRVETIRVRTGCGVDRQDWLGVDGLLTLYVRLAVAHHQSTRALSHESAADLERQLASIEVARRSASEAGLPRMEQHAQIVQRRRQLRAAAEERRSIIACDLAAIADLVRCLHDECVSVDGASASSEVPETIADGLRSAAALGELAFLHSADVAMARDGEARDGILHGACHEIEIEIETESPEQRAARREPLARCGP
jgi:hypothetical protein